MNKCIAVVDSTGKTYAPTYPKRAKGLVKHGRARFVDENTLCLTCPPDMKTEEARSMNSIFGELTVADILSHINSISTQIRYIYDACEALSDMGTGDSGEPGSPGNMMGASKADALAEVVRSRETTNQHILRIYEKIYDDLLRSSGLPAAESTAPNE